MSTRVYRTVVALYPKSFRAEYGEDMVALFEEMRRDRSPAALWWRVTIDALSSITVERMESVMTGPSSRTLVLAFFSLLSVVVALAVRGTPGAGLSVLLLPVLAGALMGILYWRSRAPYVEPEDQMHRYWWRYLVAAAVCFAGALIGTNVLNLDAWMLLFIDLIAAWFLVAAGVVLGLWHAVHRLRSTRPA